MLRDVILTVFSNSAQAPNTKWAKDFFQDEPLVLTVPGNGGPGFRSKIKSWAKTGDIFAAAVKELAPKEKIEIKRRGLVTFSVGWSAAEEIFRFDKEIQQLNAYLAVDGIHTTELKNFVKFAAKAASLEALMVMAHSSIVPPFISSTKSNSYIFEEACKINDITINAPKLETDLPNFLINPEFPKEGFTVSLGASGNLPPIKKRWEKDPLIGHRTRGSLVELHYAGNDRPDHVYLCWFTQRLMWQYLAEDWNLV